MKSLTTLCCAAALTLATTACNQAPPAAPDTHDADVKAITDLETQANKDWAAKDADKVLSFYADDAVMVAGAGDALRGKDALHAALKQMMADPALALTFHADRIDVGKSGDLGYSEGAYQMSVTDPVTHKVVQDHGNYLTTFRKQADGSWKATEDFAASAVPPATPPAKHK
ncbi:MAG TPA: SgcJ/EcaC family oxidoreductase [Terracidiphilus sp.]|nr:SgcJ/EcaC family oxidoreductase [Terracidiphilus sp.]